MPLLLTPSYGRPRGFTPFGLEFGYAGGGVDTTISVNTSIANQIQQYRNLTINNGIVLTAGFSPQIIICRTLNFGNTSSQINGDGLGPAGGTAVISAAGNPGIGALSTPQGAFNDTYAVASATSPVDLFQDFMAEGGWGNDNNTAFGKGKSASNPYGFVRLQDLPNARITTPSILLSLLTRGCRGGGGGGAGGSGAISSGDVHGGVTGRTGIKGSAAGAGAGGGSGIGGGGGGGLSSVGGAGFTGANGGAGGGFVIVICDDIIGAAGLITANGINGSLGAGLTGSGGGGGGGAVLVMARHVTTTPTLQATGGLRGGAGQLTPDGGDGGDGVTLLVRAK